MTARLLHNCFLALLVGCFALPQTTLAQDAKDKDTDGKDAAGSKLWLVDLDKAQTTAQDNKLDILMEFTGSDWCPPCIALYKDIISKEEFQNLAPKHFALLKLDNPRDKSKQTEEEKQQYKTLSAKFQITGVPTIILADAKGRPYAKIVGYSRKPGRGPEEFVTELTEKQQIRAQRDEYFAKAEKAEGVERAKLLAKAIEKIDSALALASYRDTLDEVVKLDADNKAGLKNKMQQIIESVEIKAALSKIRSGAIANKEGALKKIDELIKERKLAGESLQEALFMKGTLLFNTSKEESRAALELAIEAAPQTATATRIRAIFERFFQDEKKDDN